jgi:hypothetical protein
VAGVAGIEEALYEVQLMGGAAEVSPRFHVCSGEGDSEV